MPRSFLLRPKSTPNGVGNTINTLPGATQSLPPPLLKLNPKSNTDKSSTAMDLSTTYLGLRLRTPLVAAASPLSEEIDSIKQMEDAGASAVVLHSLFEEQLRQDSAELNQQLEYGSESFAEALR